MRLRFEHIYIYIYIYIYIFLSCWYYRLVLCLLDFLDRFVLWTIAIVIFVTNKNAFLVSRISWFVKPFLVAARINNQCFTLQTSRDWTNSIYENSWFRKEDHVWHIWIFQIFTLCPHRGGSQRGEPQKNFPQYIFYKKRTRINCFLTDLHHILHERSCKHFQ